MIHLLLWNLFINLRLNYLLLLLLLLLRFFLLLIFFHYLILHLFLMRFFDGFLRFVLLLIWLLLLLMCYLNDGWLRLYNLVFLWLDLDFFWFLTNTIKPFLIGNCVIMESIRIQICLEILSLSWHLELHLLYVAVSDF